jgi:hypothetical protein
MNGTRLGKTILTKMPLRKALPGVSLASQAQGASKPLPLGAQLRTSQLASHVAMRSGDNRT